MESETVREVLARIGIVPVVTMSRVDDAQSLALALVASGLTCAEITFRTSAAPEVIERMRQQVPDLLVGAGTILDGASAERAINAGARFIVSPGLYEGVVEVCLARAIPVFPGVISATEIGRAVAAGLRDLKLFPAEPAGGIPLLHALAAPFPDVRFIPTGGIDHAHVEAYLREPSVLAVGGSWMVRRDLLEAGDWPAVTALASEAAAAVRRVRDGTEPEVTP